MNKHLEKLMFDELKQYCKHKDVGGFLPAMKQIANVASLPGIVQVLPVTEKSSFCSITAALDWVA